MNKLHNNQINDLNFVPKEGQRGLLCSNKESFRCPSLSIESCLSKETIESLEELGNVLKNIHHRLVSEGYQISNGTISKNKEYS